MQRIPFVSLPKVRLHFCMAHARQSFFGDENHVPVRLSVIYVSAVNDTKGGDAPLIAAIILHSPRVLLLSSPVLSLSVPCFEWQTMKLVCLCFWHISVLQWILLVLVRNLGL